LADLSREARSTLFVDIGDDDLRSPLGKCFHNRATDTAGATRNEGDFVFQLCAN
jgi:hypothetical protein